MALDRTRVKEEKKETHEIVDEDVKIENLRILKTIGTGAGNYTTYNIHIDYDNCTDLCLYVKENFPELSYAGMRPPSTTMP